jgi:hypothetical protein
LHGTGKKALRYVWLLYFCENKVSEALSKQEQRVACVLVGDSTK